jgi:vacuolar-type H+-ATPase subunit I/STV1
MINYNELSYVIYLPITIFVTVWVGKELHKNGRPLMQLAFKKYGFQSWVSPINNSLLIGYYLLNIGNLLLFINSWETTDSAEQMIKAIIENIGIIITLLGIIHFFNLGILIIMNFKSNTNNNLTL